MIFDEPRVLPGGDTFVLVQFGDDARIDLNFMALGLTAALRADRTAGVIDTLGGFINPYTVPTCAWWKLGQSRPNETYRFAEVSVAEAQSRRRRIAALCTAESLEDAGAAPPDSLSSPPGRRGSG